MRLGDKYQEYLEYLKAKGAADKTIQAHRVHLFGSLSHSIQDVDLDSLTVAQVVSSVRQAGRTHGRHGENKAMVTFRSLLHWLQDSGYDLRFDWRDVPAVAPPKSDDIEYLKEEELERLRDSIDIRNQTGLRTRTLLEFLYSTGCRITEALEANREDVSFQDHEVMITNSKTQQRQKVYLSDYCIDWVKKYLDSRSDDSKALFIGGRGDRLHLNTSSWCMRKVLKRAGIKKKMSHHIFRKTFVTTLLQKGAEIKQAQYLARHKSLRITLEYYAAVDKEKAKDTHQKFFNSSS